MLFSQMVFVIFFLSKRSWDCCLIRSGCNRCDRSEEAGFRILSADSKSAKREPQLNPDQTTRHSGPGCHQTTHHFLQNLSLPSPISAPNQRFQILLGRVFLFGLKLSTHIPWWQWPQRPGGGILRLGSDPDLGIGVVATGDSVATIGSRIDRIANWGY